MTNVKATEDLEEPVSGNPEAGAEEESIEIEPADDAAEEVEEAEAQPEAKPEEVEQKAYGKRADKRIKQLWKENKEKEERLAAMQAELEQLRNVASSFAATTTNHITTQKQLLVEKQKLVEREYGEAYESGDKERLLKAQDALMETKLAIKQAEAMEAQYNPVQQQQMQQPIRQVRQPVKPPQHALDWAERNPWFGKDEIMSTVAMHINNELVAEGYSDKEPDFYAEIDARLRKELPHKFSEKKPPAVAKAQQGPTVSGQSRSSPNTKKVKLTQSDLAVCKQMGITPEAYAKHKLAFEASDDGSVEIGI